MPKISPNPSPAGRSSSAGILVYPQPRTARAPTQNVHDALNLPRSASHDSFTTPRGSLCLSQRYESRMSQMVAGRLFSEMPPSGWRQTIFPSKASYALMRMTANWRNALIIVLALALSPLSSCAQIACDMNCSFHTAGVSHEQEQTASSAAGQQLMHCHDVVNTNDKERSLGTARRGCHGDNCALSETRGWPTFSGSYGPTAANYVIPFQVSDSTALQNWVRLERYPVPDAPSGLLDVLALSGTLRI
jgi:hypothetical protein